VTKTPIGSSVCDVQFTRIWSQLLRQFLKNDTPKAHFKTMVYFQAGRFKGAQGQITGNSRGTADGRFTDHQVYKIVLPGRP
jgi:hypothetical protein